MHVQFSFSLDDAGEAFKAGVRFGMKKQRLLPYFEWSIQVQPKSKGNMLKVAMTNEEQLQVHLAPKTPRGKPTTLDGKPEWSIISGNCTVTPSEDGLSATIVSGDDPGVSEVAVKADADLGEGIVEVADFIEVTVGGARASSLGLTADAPEQKP